jgi:AraC-like DNA-binding protein
MGHIPRGLDSLIARVEGATPAEGINRTPVATLGTFKTTSDVPKAPEIETPAVVILLQGTKICYVAGKEQVYVGPRVLVGLYPIPVETQIVGASHENPFLAVGIELDISRLAAMLVRLDQVDDHRVPPSAVDATAKFSLDLTHELVDPFVRLLSTLAQPRDAAFLSDGIIDEIYYRLLSGERGPELRALLQQNGKIKRISRAVDYIHTHLDEPISVEQLAGTVHMSRTAFFANFKEVMQLTPLQYAKSVKLLEAQQLIQEGRRVNETSRLVGYNNLAQFSREYKRQFGYPPSSSPRVDAASA